MVSFFKEITYYTLGFIMMFELLCKWLLSVHNVDNVSTLATMKTLATKESPSRLVLVPYVVKSCEPNGLGDMSIIVKVTTFP